MKRSSILICSLAVSMASSPQLWASMTMEEAKAKIKNEAVDLRGSIREQAALDTLQALADNGVPVQHAYDMVHAAAQKKMTGEDLVSVKDSLISSIKEGAPTEHAAQVTTWALDKGYAPQRVSENVNAFRDLHAQGIPSEYASRIIKTAIRSDLRGNDLASIVTSLGKAVKAHPAGTGEGTGAGAGTGTGEGTGTGAGMGSPTGGSGTGEAMGRLALKTLEHKYPSREVSQALETAGELIKDGVQPAEAERLLSRAVDQGRRGKEFSALAEDYSKELRQGGSPDQAFERTAQRPERASSRRAGERGTRQQSGDRMGGNARQRDSSRGSGR